MQLAQEKIIKRCQQSVLTFCDEITAASCRSRNCLLDNVSHTSCLLNVLNISCVLFFSLLRIDSLSSAVFLPQG